MPTYTSGDILRGLCRVCRGFSTFFFFDELVESGPQRQAVHGIWSARRSGPRSINSTDHGPSMESFD